MNSNFKSRAIVISFFFLFITVLVPGTDAHSDIDFWLAWTKHDTHHGLGGTYLGDTNYLPLYHYVLYLFGILQGTDEAIFEHIKYLKVFSVLFDVLGLWVVYRWIDRKWDFLFLFFVCFFNPSFSYNSLLWGQVDAVQSALAFISFYCLFKKKIIPSMLLMLLALNFKLQVIIFIPLWGLLLLDICILERKWKALIIGIVCTLALQAVILLPFIQSEESRIGLAKVIIESVGKFGFVTWGADNFWCLLYDNTGISNLEIWFAGISYKTAGTILFCSLSFLAMVPLLQTFFANILSETKREITREQIWVSAALIAVLFFYVNTEMHERYSHPAFLFIIAYSFFRRDYFPLVIMSLAYFLNMEKILHWLRLTNYGTILFDQRLIASLYLILIIYLFYRLYRLKPLTIESKP